KISRPTADTPVNKTTTSAMYINNRQPARNPCGPQKMLPNVKAGGAAGGGAAASKDRSGCTGSFWSSMKIPPEVAGHGKTLGSASNENFRSPTLRSASTCRGRVVTDLSCPVPLARSRGYLHTQRTCPY